MKTAPGFIALISVLVISAVALLVGTGIAIRGFDELRSGIDTEQAARAHAGIMYCAEQALESLKTSFHYSGNQSFTLPDGGTCHILPVGGTGNLDRLIQVTSTFDGAIRKASITVQQLYPTTTVSAWQEVSDF